VIYSILRLGVTKVDQHRIARSNSPSPSPQSGKGPAFELPIIPNISDSPSSSAPSTPNEDAQKRNGSQVNIGSEDYFMSALKLRTDTKSAPGTPQGSMSKRNATFSPRIIFYDTWPSQEYDRRGEIATCNRLTPMLAQQIKEELNSFKMVCVPTCESAHPHGIPGTNRKIRKWRCTKRPRSIHTSSDDQHCYVKSQQAFPFISFLVTGS
jgi:hypothetical protein